MSRKLPKLIDAENPAVIDLIAREIGAYRMISDPVVWARCEASAVKLLAKCVRVTRKSVAESVPAPQEEK